MQRKYILSATSLFLLKAIPAQAVCPVCIVAVGAGLGLSEYLGIDDSIAGVWIGGLLIGMSVWTINYVQKKQWLNKYQQIRDYLIFLAYYLMVIWPLYKKGFIGNPFNKLFGLDKLLLGVVVGGIVFPLAVRFYEIIKQRNGGRAHFPFEKVAIPVGALAILSFIFYFLTK
ncbi:hypothetical protein JXE04_02180 [Patescibacteria group bacterium]|nr:hypothetical protein [Patescibacteria group bacterium]